MTAYTEKYESEDRSILIQSFPHRKNHAYLVFTHTYVPLTKTELWTDRDTLEITADQMDWLADKLREGAAFARAEENS